MTLFSVILADFQIQGEVTLKYTDIHPSAPLLASQMRSHGIEWQKLRSLFSVKAGGIYFPVEIIFHTVGFIIFKIASQQCDYP